MTPENLLLTGQVAIVTGGAQGIGKGCAQNLANFGAAVVVVDKNEGLAHETSEEINQKGGKAISIACDVRDEQQLRSMIEQAISRMGRVDCLVNNAGGTFAAPFSQVNRRGFDMLFDLNLTSVWVATQAVTDYWIKQDIKGRVVNVVSTEGLKACPGHAAYSAAKAAVINLTKTLAVELGPYGIRINSIAPDYTATPGTSNDRYGNFDEAAKKIPLGRFGTPEDTAGAILFFVTPLSRWVTGQTLVVDGGALVAARVEGAFPVMSQNEETR